MQMRRLEELLGHTLLRRTGRGVVPTTEGELFLGYASRILALGEEADARLNGPTLGGSVRIALPEEVALSSLPAVLGQFRRAHPGVALEVLIEDTATIEPLWRAGKLDVMVALPSAMFSQAVVTWNIGLSWACGLGYEPDEGAPLDLVAFAEPCAWRERMLAVLTESGRPWRITFTSRSVGAVQAAVENGFGATLLTPESVRRPTMRSLPAAFGLGEPVIVQYGLYVREGMSAAADAVVGVLQHDILRYSSAIEQNWPAGLANRRSSAPGVERLEH